MIKWPKNTIIKQRWSGQKRKKAIEMSEKGCYMANSMKTEVIVNPIITIESK
ncbi:MAG: hypothetical protein ACXQTP_06380 [Candidatus Methanofastidiosia archaeon]